MDDRRHRRRSVPCRLAPLVMGPGKGRPVQTNIPHCPHAAVRAMAPPRRLDSIESRIGRPAGSFLPNKASVIR